jgi:hypothetical protein
MSTFIILPVGDGKYKGMANLERRWRGGRCLTAIIASVSANQYEF